MLRRFLTPILIALTPLCAVGTDKPSRLDPLVSVLTNTNDVAVQRDIVRGMLEALRGRRGMATPRGWTDAYRKLSSSGDAEIRRAARTLAVLFGDKQALVAMRKTVTDTRTSEAERKESLEILLENQAPDLLPLLSDLLTDRALRGAALRGMAGFGDATIPGLILRHYASFSDAERADAVATLCSRPAFALALLDAMEQGKVPRRDLSAFAARQLLTLKDKRLAERLEKVWGTIRSPAKEKTARMNRYLALVPPDALKKANRIHGRELFARTCGACHTLFDAGGKIGPELTGAQRTRPDYLLSKILDPNAAVARDYQMTILNLRNGRTLQGIVKEETEKIVALQTDKDLLRVAKEDIEERTRTNNSLMPEGQLDKFTDEEVRDLIAYLAGPDQVSLPK
jgi:putative heme-binding domain-containing protein